MKDEALAGVPMARAGAFGAARFGSGFAHTFLPGKVVFGAGALHRVADEVEGLGVRRVLVVATNSARQAADVVEAELGHRFAGRIDGVTQHVPTELATEARAMASDLDVDAVVAIGGGSAIGLAKAVARTAPAPPEAHGVGREAHGVGREAHSVGIVAVPTTYAGSEMTPVWGETADGRKSTGTDVRVLPKVVVYDPELSRELPLQVTTASVANAIAHCVEAVWTPKADPINDAVAVEGLRALGDGLRAVLDEPRDLESRGLLLYGACLAGSALAAAGTGLHHKLCHFLGGTYNLPHAETHAAILPQVTRVNAPTVPETARRLAAALNNGTPATAGPGGLADATAGPSELAERLFDLFRDVGAGTSLRDLGMSEGDVVEAAARFVVVENPIPVDAALVREILHRAWAGARP
ncbi:maleylacetate reductase [Kribbella sp. NPDC048915]|uniref:maleylacetate reductase n=1 Tax=Kribbella sp. NPDC048915 TaxID=3155148 RepID=UPI0033C86B8F